MLVKVDERILSENHLRDAKLKLRVSFVGILPLKRRRMIVR